MVKKVIKIIIFCEYLIKSNESSLDNIVKIILLWES